MNRTNNPAYKLWFWLLIISIILIIISIVMFETYGQTSFTGVKETPPWVWVIFAITLLFWVVALILYALDVAAYNKRLEIAEACGELIPEPKKKIECPKKCVERKVVKFVEQKPCAEKIEKIEKPCKKKLKTPCEKLKTPCEEKIETIRRIEEKNILFEENKLKPLSSLSPAEPMEPIDI
jgi:hypothetical protein